MILCVDAKITQMIFIEVLVEVLINVCITHGSSCADPEVGDRESGPRRTNTIWFLSNTGPDPLENYEATKPAFNVGPSSAIQRYGFWILTPPTKKSVVFWVLLFTISWMVWCY